MKNYPSNSKSLANSFLFILPLMVLYEVAITFSGSSVKNTADAIVKTPLEIFGRNGTLIFNLIIICIFFYAAFHLDREKRRAKPSKHGIHPMSFSVYILMFLESAVYALLLGKVSQFLLYQFMPQALSILSFSADGLEIILSIGAGVYEEIVFRLLLLSALYFIFCKIFKIRNSVGGFLSIVIGAIVFSSMHYIGPFSDTFSTESFLYRFIAGIILSTIFIFRGLGIAVYTHALYDVLIAIKQL